MPKAKKQKTDGGYFWTKPNGDQFAVVYQPTIDPVSGRKTRQKKTRRIPEGASKSQAWAILEELAGQVAREQAAQPTPPTPGAPKKINGHTLTWAQLGAWYQEHFLAEPKFNSQDQLIAGCLSYERGRRHLRLLVAQLGPHNRVRDLTSEQIKKYKEQRLAEPLIRKRRRRDPAGHTRSSWLRDPAGAILWETIKLERGFAAVHRQLAMLRILLSKALAKGWITHNPCYKGMIVAADEKKRQTILTQREELTVLDQCRDHKRARHLWVYLTVMFDSGCRSAELRRLRVRHIDFEKNEFMVFSFKGGKRTERPIHMTPRARIALLEACFPEQLNPTWPAKTPDDYAITYNVNLRQTDGTSKIEYRHLKAAPWGAFQTAKRLAQWSDDQINLAGVRAHDIRHTTITRLVNSNIPTAEIMKLSGHTQMATFLRYVNPDTTARAAAADALHNYSEANVVNLSSRKQKGKSKAA